MTDCRKRADGARLARARELADAPRHKGAGRIVRVQDQLNTHAPASLYEACEPAEARRLADRLGIHCTPQHGSWLNVAEVELSVLGKRLRERVGDKARLAGACAAFERQRKRGKAGVNWRFTTAGARVKLKRLYPITEVS